MEGVVGAEIVMVIVEVKGGSECRHPKMRYNAIFTKILTTKLEVYKTRQIMSRYYLTFQAH